MAERKGLFYGWVIIVVAWVAYGFGIGPALWIARAFHLIAFVLMVGVGQAFELGTIYFAGVFAVGGLLIYEHWLVRHRDLSKAGMASLTMNGVVSVVYFVGTLGDLLL